MTFSFALKHYHDRTGKICMKIKLRQVIKSSRIFLFFSPNVSFFEQSFMLLRIPNGMKSRANCVSMLPTKRNNTTNNLAEVLNSDLYRLRTWDIQTTLFPAHRWRSNSKEKRFYRKSFGSRVTSNKDLVLQLLRFQQFFTFAVHAICSVLIVWWWEIKTSVLHQTRPLPIWKGQRTLFTFQPFQHLNSNWQKLGNIFINFYCTLLGLNTHFQHWVKLYWSIDPYFNEKPSQCNIEAVKVSNEWVKSWLRIWVSF